MARNYTRSAIDVRPEYVNDTIRELIRGAGSTFGAVAFVKKDGSIRHMVFQHAKDNSRRIVGSELGAKMSATFAKNNPNMLKCFDHNKQAWRTVTLDRVLSVRVHGQPFRFRDPRAVRGTVRVVVT